MDDLPVFLHNQISKTGAKKNLILWYDYLNPTHSNVHRLVPPKTSMTLSMEYQYLVHKIRMLFAKKEHGLSGFFNIF